MNNNNNNNNDDDDDIPNQAGPSIPPSQIMRTRRSQKAGLIFPVSRVERMLRNEGNTNNRYSKTASTFLAASLEYMCTELIQFAGWKTEQRQRKTIIPQDLIAGIQGDESLRTLLEANGQLMITESLWVPAPRVIEGNITNNATVVTKTPTRFMARGDPE